MHINFILSPLPFLGDPRRNAPLGVLSLAAVTERAGYRTSITDLRDADPAACLEQIPKADVFGFSATTPEYPLCRDLARKIRTRFPEALFILGGVHGTVCSKSIDPVFDVVVVGEGEEVLLDLLRQCRSGRPQGVHRSGPLADLTQLPWPARHLVPKESFISTSLVEKGRPATTLMTSRGCAFDCSFCASRSMWGRKCRHRSVEDVIEEIQDLRTRYGVEQLRFQDDDLAMNKKWLFEFCERLKPLKMVWRSNGRTDNAGRDILTAMRDAGCDEIGFGIESPEPAVLSRCNKKARVEDAYEALRVVRELGMKSRIFLIIGLPGQDLSVATNMITFIKETQPSAVDLSTFVPFPGSDIHQNPADYGITLRDDIDFGDYVMTRGLYGDERNKDFVFKHDILTNEQLKSLRSEVLDFIRDYNLVHNQ